MLRDDAPQTLFKMIKHTHAQTPQYTLSAYSDNAAVVEGYPAKRFRPDPQTNAYRAESTRDSAFCIKVETHNHPTAISPFAGASTGAGGEIRDEGATGRGGKPKAGLCGFRSEEHTSELQSLMRTSYAVFCLKKTKSHHTHRHKTEDV